MLTVGLHSLLFSSCLTRQRSQQVQLACFWSFRPHLLAFLGGRSWSAEKTMRCGWKLWKHESWTFCWDLFCQTAVSNVKNEPSALLFLQKHSDTFCWVWLTFILWQKANRKFVRSPQPRLPRRFHFPLTNPQSFHRSWFKAENGCEVTDLQPDEEQNTSSRPRSLTQHAGRWSLEIWLHSGSDRLAIGLRWSPQWPLWWLWWWWWRRRKRTRLKIWGRDVTGS